MKLIDVKDKQALDMLYECSALTFEGITRESADDVIRWVKEFTPMHEEVVYVIEGHVMNIAYGLTGDNAYKNDLTILCVPLTAMENPLALAIPRFQVGGRWFDDVVTNNLRRENGN